MRIHKLDLRKIYLNNGKLLITLLGLLVIRAFFGLPIASSVKEQLLQDASTQLSHVNEQDLRWLNSDFWHITVKFFGSIEPEALSTVSKALKELVNKTACFNLSIKKIAKFPGLSSNTVAAFVKPNLVLHDFHIHLDSAGEKMGIRRELRRYKPHITLAKFKSNRYSIEPVKYTNFLLPVNEIVLYESRPSDTGSYYVPLRRFELLK